MKPAASLFVTFAVLFVAWLGYLAYLVFDRPQSPQVLSRPQFLVSQLDVVGVIDDRDAELTTLDLLNAQSGAGDRAQAASAVDLILAPVNNLFGAAPALSVHTVKAHQVTVKEVLSPPNASIKAGQVLAVTNLLDCRLAGNPLPATNLLDCRLAGNPLPAKPGTLGPCLLPLETPDYGKTWRVVPLPPSPGFHSASDYRIYAADKEALAQYRQNAKPDAATPPE
jgi:hypothetical protein